MLKRDRVFFVFRWWVEPLMAALDGAGGGTGSARRRRERPLREQTSVALVLATVTHHSFDKVEWAPRTALHGPRILSPRRRELQAPSSFR